MNSMVFIFLLFIIIESVRAIIQYSKNKNHEQKINSQKEEKEECKKNTEDLENILVNILYFNIEFQR